MEIMGSAQELVDEYSSVNNNRRGIYEATIAKYGEDAYPARYDSSVDLFLDEIRIRRTGVGKWKKTGSNRNYVIYMIKNMQGNNVAQLHMKIAEKKVVVFPTLDQARQELIFEGTTIPTPEDLIKLAADKLVVLGYM